jgi:hypothetical protein
VRDRDEEQLRDPVARGDLEVGRFVRVEEQHAYLAPVTRIDQSGRVDQRHALLQREPGARQDQPPVALGDGDGETGADADPGARRDACRLGRAEVQARVVVVRPRGQRRLVFELDEAELLDTGECGSALGRQSAEGIGAVGRLRRRRRERRVEIVLVR